MTDHIPEPTKEQLEWFAEQIASPPPSQYYTERELIFMGAYYKRQYDALKAAYDAAPVGRLEGRDLKLHIGAAALYRSGVLNQGPWPETVRLVPDPVQGEKEEKP